MTALDPQSASPPRARRGRVLAVGESPMMEELSRRMSSPPIRAANVFDAIGEISLSAAGAPIDCIVTTAEALGENPQQAARALRRLDPSLKLVLLRHGSGENGLREQFDDFVTPPFDSQAVIRALDPAIHARNDEVVPAEQHETNEPQASEAADQSTAGSEPRRPPEPTVTAAQATSSIPANRAELGDTDLVEAILANDGSLTDRALALIAHHTGWRELQILPAGHDGEARGAEIRFDNQLLGRLHCPDVPATGLRPWADWLARWLALDRSQQALREMAYTDDLTGAGSRRYFNAFLSQAMALGYETRRPVTVMVFDIDDFKVFNDRFGHAAGDEILRETVRLLNSVIRKGDRVFRIGGDEFAVVFADPEAPREVGSAHPETVERIAWRFQDQICQMKFPKLGAEAPDNLSISAGLATYPWDGHDPKALLERADQRALESKRGGKNAITFGPGLGERCRRGRRG